MSVFFDHGRRHGDGEQGLVKGGQTDGQTDDAPLWGVAYEKVEGVVHLTLAFAIVGGAAVILSSALFSPGAPLGGAVEKPAEVTQASLAPAVAVAVTEPETAAPAAPVEKAAPLAQAEPAPAADSFLNARPIAEQAAPAAAGRAPEPLSPPSADMREKLEARQEAAPPPEAKAYEAAAPAPASAPEAQAEPPAAAEKPIDASKAEEGGRMARCYFKLSGRVQNSGACRVDHAGAAVVFHLPGKTLELAHNNGRVWTATLGGRNLGKVYKNKGAPCWGAKGFYACENG
jgi:hypothetical protein